MLLLEEEQSVDGSVLSRGDMHVLQHSTGEDVHEINGALTVPNIKLTVITPAEARHEVVVRAVED